MCNNRNKKNFRNYGIERFQVCLNLTRKGGNVKKRSVCSCRPNRRSHESEASTTCKQRLRLTPAGERAAAQAACECLKQAGLSHLNCVALSRRGSKKRKGVTADTEQRHKRQAEGDYYPEKEDLETEEEEEDDDNLVNFEPEPLKTWWVDEENLDES